MKRFLIFIFFGFCLFFISKKYIHEKNHNEKIYIGIYTDGFENETFKDDETGQIYWLHGNILPLIESIERERKGDKNRAILTAEVKLKGIDEGKSHHELSESGDRDLTVTEIIDIISQ
ncbi:hypothetical protein [uncultured Cetobacterium sp.]|uniref:hypothetical protein n=1 Tax=uncultured Cetobacterium sp. TaxID=527638 RepID=UPI0026115E37|nr:hypothetical protein [uncultured Cetobacterium sp.]